MPALAVPLVLVDDHRMVVLGLRTLFRNRPEVEVVGYAHDGEETVKTHLAEVRRKLGARTSAQAVAIGLINALFEYSDR
jgi:DNA-binding NarL/FixJ family response regulator